MQWYIGSITEAISVSKTKSAVFVVFVEGQDEHSKQLLNILNENSISAKLNSDHFVAIKIEGNSITHQQFSEIYPNTSIPSLFFIGKNGIPLEVITNVSERSSVIEKINSVLSINGIPVLNTEIDPVPVENASNSTNTNINEGPSIASGSGLTIEEKLQKTKDLLEKNKLEKEKEEAEKEHLKELERRKMGQSVQKLKQWQEDQEMKQIIEEREKDKRLEKAARERVLAQIAQDKAERAAKFNPQPLQKPTEQDVIKPSIKPAANSARLQFKLPDGTSKTHEFPASDTLDIVVRYIKEALDLPFSNFTLSTMFPRRQFGTDDYPKTLIDLELIPNSVILILPTDHGKVSTNPSPGGVTGFIWSLFIPFLHLFGFLKAFVFGTGGNNTQQAKPDSSSSSYRAQNTVSEVTSRYDFQNHLKAAGSKLVVIDCFASWCGPCQMIAPMLEELARENPNVVFLKINVDNNGDIISGVSALPTFVLMKNGRELTRITGANYYELKSAVQRYK